MKQIAKHHVNSSLLRHECQSALFCLLKAQSLVRCQSLWQRTVFKIISESMERLLHFASIAGSPCRGLVGANSARLASTLCLSLRAPGFCRFLRDDGSQRTWYGKKGSGRKQALSGQPRRTEPTAQKVEFGCFCAWRFFELVRLKQRRSRAMMHCTGSKQATRKNRRPNLTE